MRRGASSFNKPNVSNGKFCFPFLTQKYSLIIKNFFWKLL